MNSKAENDAAAADVKGQLFIIQSVRRGFYECHRAAILIVHLHF